MATKKTATESVKATGPIPFQDRIIISKVKPEERTTGGLYLPATAIEEQNKGIVVSVGPLVGKTLASASLALDIVNESTPKPGDVVIFAEYAGIPIPDTDYMIVKESDILAKI